MSKLADLVDKYPHLFPAKEENEPFNDWGFECSQGWYVLLDSTFNTLYHNYKHAESSVKYYNQLVPSEHVTANDIADLLKVANASLAKAKAELPVVEQCKSKFGTLRLYTRNDTPYSRGVIYLAELMSGHICEYCGNQGESNNTGWRRTLCIQCTEKRNSGIVS